ncbi:alpha-galactosidase [Mucilaginibacter sp. UR6-11]|uniref:alpha-galactosidase n=1 Tax=Mucilaginibacter sp. UR6-11 TaxID=1435644 RepID=UPI001E3DBC57|nr:alpha-galactosidase [Mucilaginibacter sp. UR6-11]MCC8425835.1 alpha-galactosidase [Mucilaginibacter sp. UR6-11]
MLKKNIALLILLTVFFNAFSNNVNKPQIIPFGKKNQLIIDLATGTFSIKYSGKIIIANAYAAFTTGEDRYQTTDYGKRSIDIKHISDKIGAGSLVTLTSLKTGVPVMKQLFYCYSNSDFIITGLEIDGHDLSSNYMAPLVTGKASLYAGQKLQTLFIPFDNDTFIRYQSNTLSDDVNTSAEVGVIYDNDSRKGLVTGSLMHDNWKSGVKSSGGNGQINKLEVFAGLNEVTITRDSMAHGSLKGDRIRSPKMFIGYFDDWRTGLETYARTNSKVEGRYIQPWTKATPVGWNSWGVIAQHINYEKAIGVVDFFDKKIPKFRNNDRTAYIDLDSFWDNMVKGGLKGDFSKLKEFVNYCKEKNLQPGVYWAPFTDWGFRSANTNRKAEGSDYKFADLWTKTDKGYHDLDGGRALDPTHPGTQARIAFVLGKLKDCGFKMIKIDFLGHGAAESTRFYDSSVTTGMQAYRVGMETVTQARDNSMLVYAAISPSLATARYVHMRRIACDAFHSIKDAEYTLNSISYGWWQTYLYDYVDADHLIFEKENVGTNRARLISGLIAGSVILGDDYSKEEPWQQQVKVWLQRPDLKQLIKSGKAFMPVDGDEDGAAAGVFIRKKADGFYLAVFNYKKQPAIVSFNAKRLGLVADKKYRLTEVLGGDNIIMLNDANVKFNQEGAYLYKVSLIK